MVRYFIDRPIFAWVIAIVIMLFGALSIRTLPIAQYPSIAPPAIQVSVVYPGASAETVQSTVVQVIEQQLSGIDNLLYFASESNKDGSMAITLSFLQGTDPDIAQVQVQNKLTLATPLLPQEVQAQGIRVAKSTKNFLLILGFYSDDPSATAGDIGDFIASSIQDRVSRLKGVGDIQLFGSQYATRIWLDPEKLNNYALTPGDVAAAIRSQNVQIASGELGGLPAVKGQQLNATIVGPSRLQRPEQFAEILLKVKPDGSQVRLKDVARIALDNDSYSNVAQFNGKPAAGLAIKLAPGANALDTADRVKQTMAEMKVDFPAGMNVVYPYDTTPFVKISIEDVVKTLIEAIVLVFIVMYVFLQNFRATIIPTIAVPVVLLGTFGVLALFGYSINVLTMFAMVLAIGLLVDDAIVVVENVERVMEEEHLSPLEATYKSMDEITGALIGIALVLAAVFLPMAFFSGSVGVIYRQFALTMASAMLLSAVVALLFTPSLCATLLKAPDHDKKKNFFFNWFNKWFDRGTKAYERGVTKSVHSTVPWLIAFVVLTGLMVWGFLRLPSSFLPDEDQGILFAQVTTPPGSSAERTDRALAKLRDYFITQEHDAVASVFTVRGFNFGGRGQTSGLAFMSLKPWDDRGDRTLKVKAVSDRTQQYFFKEVRDAQAFAFAPPAVLELGNATGFDVQLVDRANQGHEALMQARNQLLGQAAQDKTLFQVRPNGLNDEPQYKLKIDWERASSYGLAIADINTTLSAAWASTYVNDFIDRGRVKRVYIQGEADARMLPQDLNAWYVRNPDGKMVAFASFATADWGYGSPKLERYNGLPSANILGAPAPGQSTGAALDAIEKIGKKLPKGFGLEWTNLSYEEKLSGSQAPALYALSLVVVFLLLAAIYESWAVPVAVLMVVPLGILGVVAATTLRGLDNDVYFQVGLLTIIGLTAKNAILIVEFAIENQAKGMELYEATVHAAEQRLRPILMTSFAFILGVTPLAISSGAGSGAQNAIGTGVIGGMLAATVFAIFFVPLFFVIIRKRFKGRTGPAAAEAAPEDGGRGKGDGDTHHDQGVKTRQPPPRLEGPDPNTPLLPRPAGS